MKWQQLGTKSSKSKTVLYTEMKEEKAQMWIGRVMQREIEREKSKKGKKKRWVYKEGDKAIRIAEEEITNRNGREIRRMKKKGKKNEDQQRFPTRSQSSLRYLGLLFIYFNFNIIYSFLILFNFKFRIY